MTDQPRRYRTSTDGGQTWSEWREYNYQPDGYTVTEMYVDIVYVQPDDPLVAT